MFTGIIQFKGTIGFKTHYKIGLFLPKALKIKVGDSLALNGCCLTVVSVRKMGREKTAFFDLSDETRQKTTMDDLHKGAVVNLEPSLSVKDSLGGHIVQGHVDGVGKITKIIPSPEGNVIWFKAPPTVMDYLVPKGSVAIDGISLTVVKLKKNKFSVAFIPYTLEWTNMGQAKVGNRVNLEADIIGKYVSKYIRKK